LDRFGEAHLMMITDGEQQEIRVPPRRKYFTILPNIYDDSDLDPFEFRLLAHYSRVGDCWESVRTTAEKTVMSPGAVVKKRRSLHNKGWISLSMSEHGTWRIEVVDKWQENTATYGGVSGARSPGEQSRAPDEQARSPGDIKEDSLKKELH
jgi:hypothetical protein